jgi:hypothetical protein
VVDGRDSPWPLKQRERSRQDYVSARSEKLLKRSSKKNQFVGYRIRGPIETVIQAIIVEASERNIGSQNGELVLDVTPLRQAGGR